MLTAIEVTLFFIYLY